VTDGHGLFDNNLLVKDGNLGIGTTEPNTKLEVNIQGNYTKALQLNNSGNSLFFVPKNGGFGYNNLSVEGDAGLFWSDGLDGGGKNQNSGLVIAPFKDSPFGLRIDKNGNVGIGKNNPTETLDIEGNIYVSNKVFLGGRKQNQHADALLQINGKTVAKEMYVMTADWADFVFKKDYKRMNLDEIEKYINENGHLPGIPSEKEVIENGISIGEMNKLLLQKIEELTLELIELKKELRK
jgi:hypothetical protein